jgi:hypothetical protein
VFGVRSAGFSNVTKSNVWLDAVQNGVTQCHNVPVACTTDKDGDIINHNGVSCECRTRAVASSDHKPLSAELRAPTVGKVGAITVVDGWYYFHFARVDGDEPWFCNQSAEAGGHDREAFLEALYETVGDPARSISLHAAENTDGRWGCLVTDMTFR